MKKILILLFIFLLTSCLPKQTIQPDELLAYKKPFLLPTQPLNLEVDAPSKEDIEKLLEFQTLPSQSYDNSVEKALEDFEDLKWMLRTHYGKYPLYKDEYEQAFINIEQDIKATPKLGRQDFVGLLRIHTQFDDNYHFYFGGNVNMLRTLNKYELSTSYIKSNDTFINQETNQVIDDFSTLVPFLYPDFVVKYHKKNDPNAFKTTPESRFPSERLQLDETIPYAHQTQLSISNPVFDRFASIVKNSKGISVLDLRDNNGGYEFYPGQWFVKLTGSKPLISHQGYARENPSFIDFALSALYNQYLSLNLKGDHYEYQLSDTVLDKDGLIIVLQNQNTASAAEKIVDMLHHLDNTIFIGTPTRGAYTSNILTIPLYLRNTGLSVMFGNAYFDFNPDYFQENVGFEPDLYVLDEHMQEVIDSLITHLNSK